MRASVFERVLKWLDGMSPGRLQRWAHAYEKFARRANVRHVTVRDRRGGRVRDGTFHIQDVNAFQSRFKEFPRPFCGPAT